MPGGSPLSEKQLRFCQEYAAEPNATRAYRKAFPHVAYSTAKVEASKLLTNPNVLAEIAAARKEYMRHCRVSFVRVIREIANIAHADPDDIWMEGPEGQPILRPWSQIPAAARRTIQTVKIKRRRLRGGGGKDDVTEWEIEDIEVKQHSKDTALDKLCRHLGITKDGVALERLLELLEAEHPGDRPTSPTGGT